LFVVCAVVFGGYWLIANNPSITHAVMLIPLAVLAWLVLPALSWNQGQEADAFAATPSTDVDGFVHLSRFLADKWPAFSAYVLAPLVALASVLIIIKAPWAFSFFSSEGSSAGLIVPIIMWALVLGGFVIAGVRTFEP
jgi:hypothetical protein